MSIWENFKRGKFQRWKIILKRYQYEPTKCQCCPHIETSQLICCANQLTGFYMWATLTFTELKVVKTSFTNTDCVLVLITWRQHEKDKNEIKLFNRLTITESIKSS